MNNKIRLQSVGWVPARQANEIKVGDRLMWNFGSVYTVEKVVQSKTGKTIEITEKSSEGKAYTRKLGSTRLVCIL